MYPLQPLQLLSLAALSLFTAQSHAAFSLIDDMESGDNWSSDGTTFSVGIVADPADSGNNVYAIGSNSVSNADNADAYLSLGTGIANGTTGTLFFRVRTTANAGQFDWVFGASDVAVPGAWGDYEGYGAMNDELGTGTEMAVRDGSGFSPFGAASGDTWYNVWLVLNNSTDQTTLYYTTGTADATSPIASQSGAFRNGTSDALVNLFLRNNESGTTGYVDDVYLDATGANLSNPIPEPSSFALLAGCFGLAWIMVRRRS